MFETLRGPVTVLGRLLLCTIFFMAAVGNKIPHFGDVAKVMDKVGVPAPQLLLVGAIVFLLVGSVSVIVGYKARIGAGLLLVFLVLASYYFHAFWKLEGQAQQEQMIQFMKNLVDDGSNAVHHGQRSGADERGFIHEQAGNGGRQAAGDVRPGGRGVTSLPKTRCCSRSRIDFCCEAV